MVRSGFRLILESQPGIAVAAEAADGIQAVALARELRPDVCLVDIRMPGQAASKSPVPWQAQASPTRSAS